MKQLLTLIIGILYCMHSTAQTTPIAQKLLNGNERPQFISLGGILNFNNPIVKIPGILYDPNVVSMSLWLGGIKSGKNYPVIAAQRDGFYESDFQYGPHKFGTEDEIYANAQQYNKIWQMTAADVITLKEDLKDGKLDQVLPNVMAWPGRNNPYSAQWNGFDLPQNTELAPFKDVNNDGIYDPKKGDFPIVEGLSETALPAIFYWCLYNENGTHDLTHGNDVMNLEVHQTAWVYDCATDPIRSNTIFFSYKIINRDSTTIDSVYAGIFLPTDYRCTQKQMVGCAPEYNGFWMYQNSNYGEICEPPFTADEIPPAISVQFLNADMSSYIAMKGNSSDIIGEPFNAIEFYRNLTGHWRTGAPISVTDSGFSNDMNATTTKYLFYDNPNKSDGWSLINTNDTIFPHRFGLGSTYLNSLAPNDTKRIDIALTYHQDTSYRKVSQTIDLMYAQLPLIQQHYDEQKDIENCWVYESCDAKGCVYPGDLNQDGIANAHDMIDYLSIRTATTGPARGGAAYWIGQKAADWNILQYNNADMKHADASGNGTIDYKDFAAVMRNYGNTTPFFVPTADKYQKGDDLFFTIPASLDTVAMHDFYKYYPITIEKKDQNTFYAIAFQVEYDSRIFEKMKFLDLSPLLETKVGDMYVADFYYNRSKKLITKLSLKANEAYIAENQIPVPCTAIRFKNIKAVKNDGTLLTDLGAKDLNICFDKQYVSDKNVEKTLAYRIFPNPFEASLFIENNEPTSLQYAIYNIQGGILKTGTIPANNQEHISTDALSNGMYLISFQTENGTKKVEKLVKW